MTRALLDTESGALEKPSDWYSGAEAGDETGTAGRKARAETESTSASSASSGNRRLCVMRWDRIMAARQGDGHCVPAVAPDGAPNAQAGAAKTVTRRE